ncbi:uncharacterized protein LOC127247905 [Andrographis paniculata]|uniref:uncharacterized protein LOC127247905 n=1 Tax=Andrographis paniculata TaxID=175694 RepID=UPI0021E72989|nr:uncharacterized protein LOC127247905 [Andrographis paniculata]
MKSSVKSAAPKSPPSSPSFYTYLKPGALAQIRYSKITARSKEISAQTLLALCQFDFTSGSEASQPRSEVGLDMDGLPCFNVRGRAKRYPRCLQRKKLVAVTPLFSETQT